MGERPAEGPSRVCLKFERLSNPERVAITTCIGALLTGDRDFGGWEITSRNGLDRMWLKGPSLEDAAEALTPGWGARLEALTDGMASMEVGPDAWSAMKARCGIDSAAYASLEAKLVSPSPQEMKAAIWRKSRRLAPRAGLRLEVVNG